MDKNKIIAEQELKKILDFALKGQHERRDSFVLTFFMEKPKYPRKRRKWKKEGKKFEIDQFFSWKGVCYMLKFRRYYLNSS